MFDIYTYLCMFFIYAFLGWCTEVVYCTVTTGKRVNRGFLNGPVCPIYGFGMIFIIFILTPYTENAALLFVGSAAVCSLLELTAGWILKKMFHTSWWDYSDQPFNLGGYICLKFSLLWGIGGVFMMRIIQPLTLYWISVLPYKLGIFLLWRCGMTFTVDTNATIATIAHLNKDLKWLSRQAELIHSASDRMAEKLGGRRLTDAAKAEEIKAESHERIEKMKEDQRNRIERIKGDQKARFERIKAEIESRKRFGRARLLKAFPDMKHLEFDEFLQEIKEKLGDVRK